MLLNQLLSMIRLTTFIHVCSIMINHVRSIISLLSWYLCNNSHIYAFWLESQFSFPSYNSASFVWTVKIVILFNALFYPTNLENSTSCLQKLFSLCLIWGFQGKDRTSMQWILFPLYTWTTFGRCEQTVEVKRTR